MKTSRGMQERVARTWRRLRWGSRRLQWHVERQLRESVTVTTRQGVFVIPLDEGDAISRHLYIRREYEADLVASTLAFLRSKELCPPKGRGTVLDVGANNGVISIGMLLAGEFERAVAIEPDPRNFSLLKRNVRANNLEARFTCFECAASNAKGEIELELSDSNYGDHRVRRRPVAQRSQELYNESRRRVIRVKADTIDNLLATIAEPSGAGSSLVWIDTQGFEGHVLQGAERLLADGVPVVAELWPYGLARAGMSVAEFVKIANRFWSTVWLRRVDRFVPFPIGHLSVLFEQIGWDGDFDNVTFTR